MIFFFLFYWFNRHIWLKTIRVVDFFFQQQSDNSISLNGDWQVSVDSGVTKERENRRLWSRSGVSNFYYRLTIIAEDEREREKKPKRLLNYNKKSK